MSARVLLAVLLMAALGDAFAESWLVVSGRSYHFHRNGQNEMNLGAGLELRLDRAWTAGAGGYNNSSGDGSLYAVAGYSAFQRGPWRAGLMAGLVSGYERSPCLLGGLTGSVEGRRFGFNLIFIPAAGGVVFAQFKMRLD